MADNLGYTPGSGANVTTRSVTYSGSLAQMQVVGLATLDGPDDAKVPTDVSPDTPLPVAIYGELLETMSAVRFAISQLTRSIGFFLPNSTGLQVVEARQATAGVLNATVVVAGTPNVSVTNQGSVGGISANDQIPALMHLQADNLRRNISVT